MTSQADIKHSLDEVEAAARDKSVRFLRVELPDLHGIARSKTVCRSSG